MTNCRARSSQWLLTKVEWTLEAQSDKYAQQLCLLGWPSEGGTSKAKMKSELS
jgi:hypothetical protein